MKKRHLIIIVSALLLSGCTQLQNGTSFSLSSRQPWHIVVKRVAGPKRKRIAILIFNSLQRVRHLDRNKVHLTQQRATSTVTYGKYNGPDDPRAQKDLKFIKSLAVPEQGYAFLDAHLEPIPEPDPAVNQQYMIHNAHGYWTLQIGKFYGPRRKQAAVEFVNAVRNEGFPGYLYHGPVISIVTVGAFPENAVRAGNKGKFIGRMVPVSFKLRSFLKKFPYMTINSGYARFKSVRKKGISERIRSQIIKIPSANGSFW